MSGKKVLTILKIIILLLLMLSVALMLKLNYKKNLKQETSEHIEHTIVYSKAISPIKKAKANNITTVSSSSKVVLEEIRKLFSDLTWEFYSGRNKSIYKSGGTYCLDIRNEYFKSNSYPEIANFFPNSLPQGATIWEYLNKDNPARYAAYLVNQMDFKGKEIYDLQTIPNFKLWKNLKRLDFSNCKMTHIDGFSKDKYINHINYINLQGNSITDPPYNVVSNTNFDLKNQNIIISVRNLEKNSNYKVKLPVIFTKSYGNYSPVPTIYNSSNKKVSGTEIKLDTSTVGDKSVTFKINDSSSRFNGSKVTYKYKVVSQSTNNNNNNNNNNNYNYNYNSRRRK